MEESGANWSTTSNSSSSSGRRERGLSSVGRVEDGRGQAEQKEVQQGGGGGEEEEEASAVEKEFRVIEQRTDVFRKKEDEEEEGRGRGKVYVVDERKKPRTTERRGAREEEEEGVDETVTVYVHEEEEVEEEEETSDASTDVDAGENLESSQSSRQLKRFHREKNKREDEEGDPLISSHEEHRRLHATLCTAGVPPASSSLPDALPASRWNALRQRLVKLLPLQQSMRQEVAMHRFLEVPPPALPPLLHVSVRTARKHRLLREHRERAEAYHQELTLKKKQDKQLFLTSLLEVHRRQFLARQREIFKQIHRIAEAVKIRTACFSAGGEGGGGGGGMTGALEHAGGGGGGEDGSSRQLEGEGEGGLGSLAHNNCGHYLHPTGCGCPAAQAELAAIKRKERLDALKVDTWTQTPRPLTQTSWFYATCFRRGSRRTQRRREDRERGRRSRQFVPGWVCAHSRAQLVREPLGLFSIQHTHVPVHVFGQGLLGVFLSRGRRQNRLLSDWIGRESGGRVNRFLPWRG